MPWAPKDAIKHTAGASTPEKQKQWAEIANAALQKCLDDGGDEPMCAASAIKQANGVVAKEAEPEASDGNLAEASKTVGGESYLASDFLVVEEPNSPSTWHLQVKKHGTPDHNLMGAAQAALISPGGHRGKPYGGPDKEGAIRKLKALYKSEDLTWEEVAAEATGQSLESFMNQIRGKFNSTFKKTAGPAVDLAAAPADYWVRDVLTGHPELGDCVIVDQGGMFYAAKFTLAGNEIRFASQPEWVPVVSTYIKLDSTTELGEAGKRLNKKQLEALQAAHETIHDIIRWAGYEDEEPSTSSPDGEITETDLAESASGHALRLSEASPPPSTERVVPLHLDVALIQPGFGNKRDGHYYSRAMLERDSNIFVGTKMYESDHAPGKSTRLWVSTIKSLKGYTDDGAPIAEVSVHDENFARRLLALSADGLLHKMECSILANGTARKGKVEGRDAYIVEAITSADSVDWVTKAGAGGRALALSESNGGEPMGEKLKDKKPIEEQEPSQPATFQEQNPPETPAPATLSREAVVAALSGTHLPPASVLRLAEADYADETALTGAIGVEIAALKEATGSGRPFGQGGNSASEQPKPRAEEQKLDDFNRIMREVGSTTV